MVFIIIRILATGYYYFLTNPAVICYSVLQGEIRTGDELGKFVSQLGTVLDFVINNWFAIRIVVQPVISVLLIVWAAWLLDPLKKMDVKRMRK